MSKFKIEIGNWIEYRADGSLEEPDNDRQLIAWTKDESGTPVVGVIACTSGSVPSNFCLQIDTTITGTDRAFFEHGAGTAPFHVNVSNEIGYTIEFQCKVVDLGSAASSKVFWQDDVYKEQVTFGTGFVGFSNDGSTYPLDTITDYHIYRVVAKSESVRLYVDDILRINGTLATTGTGSGNMFIRFGDLSASANIGGEIRLAYCRYRIDNALAPKGNPNEDWVFSNFDDIDKRRVQRFPIIRSDNSIIPDNKMQPKKVRVVGTVVGSDYGSYRNSVRRLKKMLNNGTQRIVLDDEHFIDGLHTDFSLRLVKQDFANFTANFECRYPYWEENWATYFSTAPVSAATFYINNASDLEIPCRVIITGAATGTIENDIDLRNITLDQQGKYVATLAATQELFIDKGFEKYNDYKIEVANASSFGSYEGDLFTLAPGENAFVFTGGAVGTIEFYYRQAYLL